MSKKKVIRDTKTLSLLDAYTRAKGKLIDHLQASLKLTYEDAAHLVTVHGEATEKMIGSLLKAGFYEKGKCPVTTNKGE